MKIEKWETPVINVLERGAPEEAVLGGCKFSEMNGASNYQTSCKKKTSTILVTQCTWCKDANNT